MTSEEGRHTQCVRSPAVSCRQSLPSRADLSARQEVRLLRLLVPQKARAQTPPDATRRHYGSTMPD